MEECIEKLNKILLQSINKNYLTGITQGKMGISIYFYHLAIAEQNEEYKTIAEQLLDDTLNRLFLESSISVESGLAGIALGVRHLINTGFVEGDVNELLEDIDDAIFKRLIFPEPNLPYDKGELLHLLFYLSKRLNDQVDENSRYIYCELIIYVLNIFVTELNDDFFNESLSFSIYDFQLPVFTYICACLLKQNIYNNRIYKIVEEFEPKILSQFPALHANRLYLLCGILPLVPYMRSEKWKNYIDLLRKEIKLQVIFEKEMSNKHIFVSNGLSLIYLLLYYLENKYPDYKIDYNSQDFYDKIMASEAWESLFKSDYFFEIHRGLLNGFPGVKLVLSHIQKQIV